MELKLVRDEFTDQSTSGKLYVDGTFQCFCLEDPIREHKVAGDTAIPYGKYAVIVSWSNRFHRLMPLLVDVPGFSGIRIHSGNTSADTEGCILVGRTRAPNWVGESRMAFDAFFPHLQAACEYSKVYIEVTQ
jgi:hypothetical protein